MKIAVIGGSGLIGSKLVAALSADGHEVVPASPSEFYDDLKKFDVPALLMHGEDDQIVPIDISSRRSARLIKGAVEIYYPGLPHGLTGTHADLVNRDLLAFCQQGQRKVA